MASTSSSTEKSPRILAKVLMNHHSQESGGPGDCITCIRCNGRLFYIGMSPVFICGSPVIESRYRKFIGAVKGTFVSTDEEHEEQVLEDFQNWLIAALEPLFLEVCPDVPPSFDPEKLATGEARPVLSEYLFPDEYYYRLETDKEKVFPVRSEDEDRQFIHSAVNHMHPELAEELEQHGVKFLDPSEIEVAFQDTKEALFTREPTRVLVDTDGSGRNKTLCHYNSFGPGGQIALEKEAEAHLRVLLSTLAPDARVVRLLGVVTVPGGMVTGLLLTQIDHGRYNTCPSYEGLLLHVPIPLRQRWKRQIGETVEQLHEAGLIWGDATPWNVLIDRNDDAWLIGFGGGYAEGWPGWVDEDKFGTKEGDLQGLARIVEHLSNEEYEEFKYDSCSDDFM
ncbi:hypothetical protein V8F06_010004 [Rhypophila decipiens]